MSGFTRDVCPCASVHPLNKVKKILPSVCLDGLGRVFGTASLSPNPPALRPQRLEEPGAFPQPHRKPVSARDALSTRQILRLRLLQAPTSKLKTCDLPWAGIWVTL